MNIRMHAYIFIFYLSVITFCKFNLSSAQTLNKTENTLNSTLPSIATTTTESSKNITCEVHNNDCKACLAQSKCYYCDENNHCYYDIQNIKDGECNVKNAYIGTCKVSLKWLLIVAGVLIGVVLLIILIVCCYCCCKKKGVKVSKDDLKWARQKEERKQIAAERREERAKRTEEIRKKYGLVKDSNPYQRFDA